MASKLGGMMFRKFSTSQAMRSQGATPEQVKLWRNLTLFGAIPSLVVVGIYVYLEHEEEEHHYKRPEFIAYDHMRIHNKGFPWGDGNHPLFFNKEKNALPSGYED